MTLVTFHNLSLPKFPHLQKGGKSTYLFGLICELNDLIHIEFLEKCLTQGEDSIVIYYHNYDFHVIYYIRLLYSRNIVRGNAYSLLRGTEH